MSKVNAVPRIILDEWGSSACASPELITLCKLNALQEQVRLFRFGVFDCCIMSYSSNLPLASQQVPWPLPLALSATLDDTTNDDMMI